MLVLTRNKNQRIMIEGGIVLTVVDIRGDKVRIGLEAPPHISINREEVHFANEKRRHEELESAA